MFKKYLTAALIGLIGLAILGWILPQGGKVVTREQFGENWPFTVESGRVDCVKGMAYTFETNSVVYALNGFATSWLKARDLHEIWARDPNYPDFELYVNIGDIQKAAEAQC